jgi:hypothetical protein
MKDDRFELEVERDRYARECEQLRKSTQEKQKMVEGMKTQVEEMKLEFETYQRNLEVRLESKYSPKMIKLSFCC